jgi:hypothetical protein
MVNATYDHSVENRLNDCHCNVMLCTAIGMNKKGLSQLAFVSSLIVRTNNVALVRMTEVRFCSSQARVVLLGLITMPKHEFIWLLL